MIHKINIDDKIARIVYNLSKFNISGNTFGLDEVLNHLKSWISKKAIEVCTDASVDHDHAFERGYVAGIDSAVKFFEDSVARGDLVIYQRNTQKTPKKWV